MKQEEAEVPNKDPKGFQTLKLSAQSSSFVAPDAQKPSIVTGPLTPKAKQMLVRRGDVIEGTSIPTQPAYTTGRPIAMVPGTRYQHWTEAAANTTAKRRGGTP